MIVSLWDTSNGKTKFCGTVDIVVSGTGFVRTVTQDDAQMWGVLSATEIHSSTGSRLREQYDESRILYTIKRSVAKHFRGKATIEFEVSYCRP